MSGGPFDDLDPGALAEEPEPGPSPRPLIPPSRRPRRPNQLGRNQPGAVSAFIRGAAKRCPRCGSGGLFRSWFAIRDRCPRCGLRMEREEGGFLCPMVLSYIVTAAAWLGLLLVWLIVDLPDLHVAELTIASVAVAGLVPLLFRPFS